MSDSFYFRVNGMKDSDCEAKIQKNVSLLSGVDYVEADVETGMVFIRATISPETIIKAIDSAGYNAILLAD